MGGDSHSHAASSHGHGHGSHDHHHHEQPIENSVIKYEIPDAPHHVEDFKAPDWRLFKVENAPELAEVQHRLAAQGLKDPWLRNEVWRYDSQFGAVPVRTGMLRNAGTGMKWGLALAVGTVLLQTGYNAVFKKGDAHHGHGHH